jgi:hypothetical protein
MEDGPAGRSPPPWGSIGDAGGTAASAIPPVSGAPPIAAGGIANGGNAMLNSTKVDNNTGSFTSGAGIVNHGTMTLNKSEVNGNTAAGIGLDASGGGHHQRPGPARDSARHAHRQ